MPAFEESTMKIKGGRDGRIRMNCKKYEDVLCFLKKKLSTEKFKKLLDYFASDFSYTCSYQILDEVPSYMLKLRYPEKDNSLFKYSYSECYKVDEDYYEGTIIFPIKFKFSFRTRYIKFFYGI